MTSPNSHSLFVAGAVSFTYLLFPSGTITRPAGGQSYAKDADAKVSSLVIRTGGADLVAQLLTSRLDAAPQSGIRVVAPLLQNAASNLLKHNASYVCELSLRPGRSDAYTIDSRRRIGHSQLWHSPSLADVSKQPGSTVIIVDSEGGYKDVELAVDFLTYAKPRYIIHNQKSPLATGVVWDCIRNGPMTRDGIPEPDYLAVILDADDLRAEGIPLSRALSWEATAEDFVRNLGSNGRLDTLVTCPNLIVRFGLEAVIHHRGRSAIEPTLYYSPRYIERQNSAFKDTAMVETASAFTAGFALGFAGSKQPDCDKAIRLGMAASNNLASLGLMRSEVDGDPDFPTTEVMEKLVPERAYASVSIPSAKISSGERWTIFDSVTGDTAELARQIVAIGPLQALGPCPVQRFGDLLTVDRAEQECLRSVADAIDERLQSQNPTPTSIGLVGPFGAGKTFTAMNLAKHIAARTSTAVTLTYNAQLLKQEELVAVCHTIRDHTASGTLTAVLFENAETVLTPGHHLHNDFRALMRDGSFSERGQIHSLGSPLLLLFSINQDHGPEVATFDVPPTPVTPTAFELGSASQNATPLHLDHLHGLVRVLGPNQLGPHDKAFAVRRAVMLRRLLEEKFPHLNVNGRISIEEGVLRALLLVPTYKLGLRSLDRIISTSRLSGRTRFDVAALPPEEQIQLHVDGRQFMAQLRSPRLQPALRERLAQGLFETYKKRREEMCKTEEERKALETDRSYREWEELSGELKESTRAQADDIPRKLRAVGCFMLNEERSAPLVRVTAFTEEELLMLAEMEHERFNAERLQRQWRMGPRNSKQRTTPFLVPWRDLTQEWKDVDAVMVECVPRLLEKAGWYVYRMQDEVTYGQ